MTEKTVTISEKEYESLKWASLCLNLLRARGVDNWDGYCTPPDKDDYDTIEEWEVAYEEALYSYQNKSTGLQDLIILLEVYKDKGKCENED